MFSRIKAGLLLLAVVVSSGCSTLKDSLDVAKPSADVKSVKVTGLTSDSVDLLVNLAINNPNAFALNTSGMDLDLKVEGTSLVSLDEPDKGLKLPARGSATTSVPVSLKFVDLYNTVGKLKDQDSFTYTLDAGFIFNLPVLGNVRIPASYSDSLPIPKMPQISFRSARLSDLGWTGASLELVVDVLNPNSFGVDLNSLNYQVVSGGSALGSGQVKAASLANGEKQQLTIPLSVSFAEMGASVIRMLKGDQAMDIGLQGKLDFTPDLKIWQPAPLEFDISRSLSK